MLSRHFSSCRKPSGPTTPFGANLRQLLNITQHMRCPKCSKAAQFALTPGLQSGFFPCSHVRGGEEESWGLHFKEIDTTSYEPIRIRHGMMAPFRRTYASNARYSKACLLKALRMYSSLACRSGLAHFQKKHQSLKMPCECYRNPSRPCVCRFSEALGCLYERDAGLSAQGLEQLGRSKY